MRKEKRKNDDYFDPVETSHIALDGAIDRLREVLHIQLDLHANFRRGRCSIEAIEQVSHLVLLMQDQVRMILSDELIDEALTIRKRERAIEYETLIRRFELVDLKPYLDNEGSETEDTSS